MEYIEIQNLNKNYGKITACDNISINIKKGEIVCLLGESGCGKSTLLKIIAGFELATSGDIILNNKEILSSRVFVKPESRNVAILFQEHSLFPHLTVRENIELALKKKNNSKVEELMMISNIKELEGRYPHQISGGQQQRVALVRTLLQNPDLLLLDEPFSNLDDNTKTNLRTYFKKSLKKNNLTTIFVTHDIADASSLADRVLIMDKGKIIADDDYFNLYMNIENELIGKLFKNINILKPKPFGINYDKFIGVYPNSIILNEGNLTAEIINITPLYDKFNLLLEYNDQLFFTIVNEQYAIGSKINFHFDMTRMIYY